MKLFTRALATELPPSPDIPTSDNNNAVLKELTQFIIELFAQIREFIAKNMADMQLMKDALHYLHLHSRFSNDMIKRSQALKMARLPYQKALKKKL